jgi:gliding motility-associated-like protein
LSFFTSFSFANEIEMTIESEVFPDPTDTTRANINTLLLGTASIFVLDNEGCVPATFDFLNPSAEIGDICNWDFGDGTNGAGFNPTHTYTTEGCFDVTVTITAADGSYDSLTITDLICVYEPPVAEFSVPDPNLSTDDTEVDFSNLSTNADSYEWNFGGLSTSTEVSPIYTFPDEKEGAYEVCLRADNDEGCTNTACKVIRIQENLIYYVPNAFTPDGDSHNQTFQPVFTSGFDPYDYHLIIFNREGQTMFESYNAVYGWDGTYGGDLMEDGIYVWKIEFKDRYTDKRHSQIGHLSLIR